MIRTVVFLIVLVPLFALSQVSITGKVINQADTKPVARASVFLSNATTGTATAGDGSFSLKNVMPGKYNLVVSILGFDEAVMPIAVGNQDIDLQTITLYPKTVSLNAVTVSAKRNDPQWSKNYDKFKTEFLGRTELARDCKILNPEVLQLHYDVQASTLSASSSDFLEIENDALGYKIKYLLKEFLLDNSAVDVKALTYHGYTLFEQMSGTAAQQSDWKKNREKAYEGSQMHFLRAVANNTADEDGFRVLHLPLKSDNQPNTVVYVDKKTYDEFKNKQAPPVAEGPDRQGIYKLLNHGDRLYITYNKYHHFSTSRYTTLNEAGNTLVDFTATDALFDGNGALLDPKSIVYDGAWTRSGVANLLPVDYVDDNARKAYATAAIRLFAEKLKTYADSVKTEKVYLHFDKPYYAVNDTIYFKAYVTGGGNGRQLSELSGLLNVDLINPAGKINRAIKLKLDNGIAWGDFVLPDSLKGGRYRVRAYTNWMRNEGEESFFEKMVYVGDIDAKPVPEGGEISTRKNTAAKIIQTADVQLMPEGGSLVIGNYSKVAIKALGPDGLGKDFKGIVADDTGEEVCRFESGHAGMGSFFLVPKEGKTYKAAIKFADSTNATVALPKAVTNGYTMTVNNAGADTLRIRIAGGANSTMPKLGLVAQAGGQVYYAAENSSGNKYFSVAIPKNKFPWGILQLTLLSASGEPLNERPVFIEQPSELSIELKPGTASYAARQKITLQLSAKNDGHQTAPGNYSVAVIDEAKVPADATNEATILTSLLLTSDLKGNVEQPGYYFENPTEKTRADLDNLLLTQGFRRFSWKQVTDTTPRKYRPESTITISGTVKRSGKLVPNAAVKLFSKMGGMFMLDTVTDVNGKFAFKNLIFADSTKFVVQSRIGKGQDDATLELDTIPSPKVLVKTIADKNDLLDKAGLAAYTMKAQQFYDEQKKYGINQHKIMLKEVKVEAKKDFTENSSNLNGKGRADQVVTANDLKNLVGVTLSFRLRQKLLTTVKFVNGVPHRLMPYSDAPMLLVVDGNYVEYDEYDHLDPDRIQSVEVMVSSNFATMYGAKASGGIMVITTKRGKDYEKDYYYRYAPGVITYMPKGFYKAREFYSPQYDNPHTNQKMADLRSTIYWNPNIITDKDGKASFSYFNADGKGTYRVVIEGIDADGNLGRQVLRYKVE